MAPQIPLTKTNPFNDLLSSSGNRFKKQATPATTPTFNPQGVAPNVGAVNTPVAPNVGGSSPVFTKNESIVDFLTSNKQPSDFGSRSKLAAGFGIQNYAGTAEQNTKLLGLVKGTQEAPVAPQTTTEPVAGVGQGLFTGKISSTPAAPIVEEEPTTDITTPVVPTTPAVPIVKSAAQILADRLAETQDKIVAKQAEQREGELALETGQVKIEEEASGRGIALPLARGQQAQLAKQRGFARRAEASELQTLTEEESNIINQLSLEQQKAAANAPIQIGGNLVQKNPVTGEFETVFTSPENLENKGFSLSPGQVRFNAEGQEIARVDDTESGNAADISGLTPTEISSANFLAKQLYGSSTIKTKDGYNNFVRPILARMAAGETLDSISDSLRFQGQSPEFNGIIRDAAQQITSKLSAKRTETIFDKLDDALSSDDPGKVRDFLKKIAIENSPGGTEQAKQITGQERTVEFLDEIYGDLQAFENAGGKTNIFRGTLEEIAKKAGAVKDPELRKIAVKITKARQQYRRAMTGVAFSPGENLEYDAVFPSISKTAEFNTAVIDGLRESFRGDVDFFYRFAMGGEAYDSLFKGKDTKVNISDDERATLRAEYPDLTDEEFESAFSFNNVGSDTNIAIGSRLGKANNNPGNLRLAGQTGATQGEGGFAKFSTPEAGYQALKNQIKLDGSRGKTLAQFITKYAPPNENDTELYIRQMVAATGVNKNTLVSDIDLDILAKAMALKESNTLIA